MVSELQLIHGIYLTASINLQTFLAESLRGTKKKKSSLQQNCVFKLQKNESSQLKQCVLWVKTEAVKQRCFVVKSSEWTEKKVDFLITLQMVLSVSFSLDKTKDEKKKIVVERLAQILGLRYVWNRSYSEIGLFGFCCVWNSLPLILMHTRCSLKC